MRISRFKYKGKQRVAVEHGADPRGCGLLTTQLSPERGTKTFKPGRMIDTTEVKGLGRLYWYCRYKVGL